MTLPTKGGYVGHIIRRLIHVAMIIIPWLYYWYGNTLADLLRLSKQRLVLIGLLIVLIADALRLQRGWLIVGQRHYETKQLSAFAWGAIGIAIVLLATPEIGNYGAGLGFPLIASLALVDPLLGELRICQFKKVTIIFVGVVALGLVWGVSSYYFGIPFWWVLVLVPVTLVAELYKIPKVDDNFVMLIVPLVTALILYCM